jgi:Flp pilus assembly protein TadD
MSLINRMLTDLESRRGGNLRNVDSVIDGLQPSEAPVRAPAAKRRTPLILGISLGVASVAALIAWQAWKDAALTPTSTAVAPPPTAMTPTSAAAQTAVAPPAPAGSVPVVIADPPTPAPVAAPVPAPAATGTASGAPSVAPQTPPQPAPVVATESARAPEATETADPAPPPAQASAPARSPAPPPSPPAERPRNGSRDTGSSFVIANANTPAETAELALALLDSGRPEEAEALLREGLAVQPEDSEAARVLGHLLLDRGEARGALDVLSAAAPPITEDTDYHALMAAAEQRGADHRAAARRYRDLLALQPGNGQWRVGLGISLLATGDRNGAAEAFRQALADPSLPPALRSFAMQQAGDGAEGNP